MYMKILHQLSLLCIDYVASENIDYGTYVSQIKAIHHKYHLMKIWKQYMYIAHLLSLNLFFGDVASRNKITELMWLI